MASYHLNASIVSRANGHSAVAAAAYQHRCALLDERRDKTENYSNMDNKPLFEGLYVPKEAPSWAQDREKLWNAAERAEDQYNRKYRTAQVARSFDIALPYELSAEQNRWLLQDFVRENFTRKGYAADVAIHPSHEHGDERNVHAHLLVSLRKLGPEGFSATKDTTEGFRELQTWRKNWAEISNRHLQRHGHEARVDHRSFEDRGIDREAEIHVGKSANAGERKRRQRQPTERGERNREIKGRNHSRRSIEKLLKELAEQQQGQTPASAPPPEVNNNMADERHPVDKAFSRFEGAVGALFDLTIGRGADGVPGSSAEQYPGQGNKITLNVDNMNVGKINTGQQPEPVAPTQEHEPSPSVSNASAHEAQQQSEAQHFASRDAEERAYYESLEREQREQELERERDRDR